MEEEDDDEEEGVEKGEPGEMPRRREETVGGVHNADHHIETAVVITGLGCPLIDIVDLVNDLKRLIHHVCVL